MQIAADTINTLTNCKPSLQTLCRLLEDLRLNPADLLPSLAHLGVVLVKVANPHLRSHGQQTTSHDCDVIQVRLSHNVGNRISRNLF